MVRLGVSKDDAAVRSALIASHSGDTDDVSAPSSSTEGDEGHVRPGRERTLEADLRRVASIGLSSPAMKRISEEADNVASDPVVLFPP
ncbi:MAG: hypothetical protein ACJASK_002373, partial [Ilumatobacter sp.]